MIFVDFAHITDSLINKHITVGGFVHSIRDHGGLIFIDLRSQTEIVQCVIDPNKNSNAFDIAQSIHSEYVLKISGEVQARSEATINPNIPTGKIEILVDSLGIISKAKTLPFDIHQTGEKRAGEEVRLKYRYLDLRREHLKSMLTVQHKLFLDIRNWFDKQGFVEIRTPILANSTPEGARDYVVPSRLYPGHYYALPQAPQQFKQLLMVGGFNKYFQIAPCFRDEDPRSDRHPGDFYQLDVEIAWADQESIFELNEIFARQVLSKYSDKLIPQTAFERITYQDAIESYGSDKPDLRYGLKWIEVKELFKDSGFGVFDELNGNQQARIKALVIPKGVELFSRSDLDKIQDIGRQNGLPGIAYIQLTQEGAKSPILKFFGDETKQLEKVNQISSFCNAQTGDVIIFVANHKASIVHKAINQMRQHIAQHLQIIDKSILKFVWVYDFPFFEIDEKTGGVDFGHNPFSVWQHDQGLTKIETLTKYKNEHKLAELKAFQYDLTLNGYEVLSGGVRNSEPEALFEAFRVVGYTDEEVRAKFPHMLEAYEYGAPPHAGFAWGLERMFMVLLDEQNIREIIAFPKNGSGIDSMTGSPSPIGKKQLAELGIKHSE